MERRGRRSINMKEKSSALVQASKKLRIISDKDSAVYRIWDPKEEGQSVLEGMDREDQERKAKQLKLENLIKARGSNGRTQQRRTPE